MAMNKFLKVTTKILKGYLIFDIIALAIVGAGEILDELKKHPEESIIDNDTKVFGRSLDKIKNYFKRET